MPATGSEGLVQTEKAEDRSCKPADTLSHLIEPLIPLGKGSKAVSQGGGGFEAKVMLKRRDIGICDGDVAALHWDELLVGFEVVVLGKHARSHEFLG